MAETGISPTPPPPTTQLISSSSPNVASTFSTEASTNSDSSTKADEFVPRAREWTIEETDHELTPLIDGMQNSSGLMKGHYQLEYARSLADRAAQLSNFKIWYDNWKGDPKNKNWLNDLNNAGKIHPDILKQAQTLGYTLDTQAGRDGFVAFVNLAESMSLERIKAVEIQAKQLSENAVRRIEFWEEQLVLDMKAIAQTIKLASTTG